MRYFILFIFMIPLPFSCQESDEVGPRIDRYMIFDELDSFCLSNSYCDRYIESETESDIKFDSLRLGELQLLFWFTTKVVEQEVAKRSLSLFSSSYALSIAPPEMKDSIELISVRYKEGLEDSINWSRFDLLPFFDNADMREPSNWVINIDYSRWLFLMETREVEEWPLPKETGYYLDFTFETKFGQEIVQPIYLYLY